MTLHHVGRDACTATGTWNFQSHCRIQSWLAAHTPADHARAWPWKIAADHETALNVWAAWSLHQAAGAWLQKESLLAPRNDPTTIA